MLSGRDRALAWFLGVQLVVAIAFGAVLVHALRKPATTTVAEQGVVAAGPTQAAQVAAAASPGATTAVVGGSAGSAGSAGTAGSGGLTDKGTGAGAVSSGGAGAPITFGSIVMQNFSISLADSKYGTQAYLQQLNAKGGAGGHKINMIYDDDQGSPSTGSNEVNQLIAQNVFAFAAFNAPETEGDGSLVKKLEQNQIPLIGSYGESSEYTSPYAFAFSAYYVHYGYEMGLYLAKKGATAGGIVYVDNSPDTTANAAIERGFADGMKAGGGSVAAVEKVDPINPNYSQYLNDLQSKGATGVAMMIDTAGFKKFFQAKSSSYHPTLLAQALFDQDSVKAVAQTDKYPVYVASDLAFPEQASPAVTAFVQAMQASGHAPTYFAEQGWIDAVYLAEAVSKLGAQGFTRAQLLAAVNSLSSFQSGFTAPMQIAPGAHDMNRCIQFGVVQNAVLTPTQGWTCDNESVP